MAFWHTFANAQQVVINTLSGLFFAYREELCLRQDLCGGSGGWLL
jgi:hypothetical protein